MMLPAWKASELTNELLGIFNIPICAHKKFNSDLK